MTLFKHIGSHADSLANGQVLGPGETVDLSASEERKPHNQSLIKHGVLIAVKTKAEKVAVKGNKEGEES